MTSAGRGLPWHVRLQVARGSQLGNHQEFPFPGNNDFNLQNAKSTPHGRLTARLFFFSGVRRYWRMVEGDVELP